MKQGSLKLKRLSVAPKFERFSTVCDDKVKPVDIKDRGKLTLQPGCKAYSSTLYAMTTITKNVSNGFLPTVPMDFDCC